MDMDSGDKTPDDKPPNDNDRSEWKAWGFVVGLIPAAFLLAGVSEHMTGQMKDSTANLLLVGTIVCVSVAGFLFAQAAPKREREMPFSQVFHAVAGAVGFAILDLYIACVGCTCQAMHKL